MSVSNQPLNGLMTIQGNVNNNHTKLKNGSNFREMTGFNEIKDENPIEYTEQSSTHDNHVMEQYAEINPMIQLPTSFDVAGESNFEQKLVDISENSEQYIDLISQAQVVVTEFESHDTDGISDLTEKFVQTDTFVQNDSLNDLPNEKSNLAIDFKYNRQATITPQISDSTINEVNKNDKNQNIINLLGGKYQQIMLKQNQGEAVSIDNSQSLNNLLPINDKFAHEIMGLSQGRGKEQDSSSKKFTTDVSPGHDELDSKVFGRLESLSLTNHASAESNDVDLDYGLNINTPFSDKEGWNNQLHQNILWMSSQKMHSASISMNPSELGPVDVNIQFKNDALSIVFNSKHQEVRQAIEHALPELKQLFAEQMIQVNAIEITDMHRNPQNSSGNLGEHTHQNHQHGETFSQIMDNGLSNDVIDDTNNDVVTHRIKTSLVDYFA